MSTEVMSRYTDTLYVTQPTQQTRNELGDLVDTKPAERIKWGMCREVPSGGNRVLTDANGTTLAYQSEIYLHPLTAAVPLNSYVEVVDSDEREVLHGRVLRYKKYRHYAKVWI